MQTIEPARPAVENTTTPGVVIRAFQFDADAEAFRALNEQWITRYFVLEEKDRETLDNPEAAILEKGGSIFFACSGEATIGCVALIPAGDGVYELSKMAVASDFQGRGIGRKLLEHAIAHAKAIGAASLFLGSNSKLQAALHLYESAGFRYLTRDEIPDMPYNRANVFMKMPL